MSIITKNKLQAHHKTHFHTMKVYNARSVYSLSIEVFSEVFTCFKVINAFKQQNLWTDRFPESSTSLHQSFLSFLHKTEHGAVTGSNSHPQFPRSPLVTPGTMIPLLARTQARLTTYFSDLCFKSLASKCFFFFPGNKFLLSTQKTRRLSQSLKKCALVSLESSKHVGFLVSDLILRISSKPSFNSFLFDFVFTIHRKPGAISTLISRQQFRITYFHLTDELTLLAKIANKMKKPALVAIAKC